jgi:hypothetical protein
MGAPPISLMGDELLAALEHAAALRTGDATTAVFPPVPSVPDTATGSPVDGPGGGPDATETATP